MILIKGSFMKKIYQIPAYFLVLLFIFFEDIIWDKLAKPIAEFFKTLSIFSFVEKLIVSLNKYVVLSLFLVIFIFAEYLTPVSLSLISDGQVLLGGFVYLLKIPSASLAFWIFRITEEELLSIGWFNNIYQKLQAFISYVKNTSYFINAKEFYLRVKTRVKEFFKKEKELFFIAFLKRVYKRQK